MTRYPNFQYEERPPGLAALARQSPSMRTPDAGRGVVNPPLATPTPGSDTGPLTAGQVVRNALIGRAGIAAPTPAATTADATPDFSGALDANPALMAANTAAPTPLATPTPTETPPVASPLSARAVSTPPSTVQAPAPAQPLPSTAQPDGLPAGVTRVGNSFSGTNVVAAQPAPDPNALGGRADTFNQLANLQAQNASVPQGGANLIDGAGQGAEARTKFFDEANLRNVLARGPMPGRNGAAAFDTQVAAARSPLAQRALGEQNALKESGDTQRAQIQEQGLASRARVVDARQQQANSLAERRVDIEAVRAGQGNIPSGYQRTADGGLTFIKGGPADPSSKAGGGKPLTEGQSKALLFGTRMQASEKVLGDLEKAGKLFSTPGANAGYGIGAAVNLVNSKEGQQLDQAKRDFLNAVLRRESGAVIADPEFENGNKQYFPQVGDAPEVIAQKKANRELATRGILAEVPDSESRVAQVRGPDAAPSAPAALPGGMSRQIGTSGGKPVYEDAQGNRFVGG